MNRTANAVRCVLLATLALAGCASPAWKRMANTDGLLDFLIGGGEVAETLIERVSGDGGMVATAHLRAYGKNVFVSGLVRRQFSDPPPWSHVDVIVLDSRQRVVETTSTTYLPRDIPHGQRGAFPQSHYTARLAALPAAGSTVKVVFHGAHRSECEFAERS
jgi:hypothetical protein